MPTKILAIDDSKTMRLAIKITFAAEDADVTSVSKGSDAVARAKQMEADIILVDANLADGEPSGYDVCEALKNDPGTDRIPVLLMVSNQTGPDEARLKSAGADGVIVKPFDTQELIDRVSAVVGSEVTRPATKPKPAAVPRPAVTAPAPVPSVAPAARPRPAPSRPASTAPVSRPAANHAAASPGKIASPSATKEAPMASKPVSSGNGQIPIAIPIPFTAADSPTPGILQRLQEASGSAAAGLDPQVAQALVSLSRELIEQVVWEVVPDLAEAIIKKQSQAKSA